MKSYRVLTLALFFSFFSCKKKDVYYTGTVYSKHHIPMPHLSVKFGFTKGNDNDRAGFYEVTTDDNGRYLLEKTIPKNRHVESISIQSDSGFYYDNARNNLEITLQ